MAAAIVQSLPAQPSTCLPIHQGQTTTATERHHTPAATFTTATEGHHTPAAAITAATDCCAANTPL